MDDPHGARHASGAPDRPTALMDDDGEDFAVEVTSLVPAPLRTWGQLRLGVRSIWARLTSSPWISTRVAAMGRVRDRLPISSWIALYAAALRVWPRFMAESWALAYYALAVKVWCLLAISLARAWGRRAVTSWLAARDGAPPRLWDFRLSRCEKLRRGAVIAVALLAAFAVIFGPGIVGSIAATRSAATSAAHDVGPDVANAAAGPQLGDWQSVPVPLANNQPVAYTPAPADPSTIYACGAGSALHDSGFVPGNLQLWRTHDAGATWQALSAPRFLANLCDLRIAATAPSRLTLLATSKGCQSYGAYISDDGGDQWTSITLPYSAEALPDIRQCDLIATASHLYLWYSYGLQLSESNDRSELMRSDDDGRSWTTVSPGIAVTEFCNVAISTPSRAGDDVLLASCPSTARGSSSPALRQSTDSGQRWRTLGAIPATGASILFTPTQASSLGQLASTPLYAAYTLSNDGALSGLRLIQTLDGQHWQPLPPLPVHGASPGLLGVRSILGTTDDGRLYVLGVNPGVGVTATASSASSVASAVPADRWVWIWDPSSSHWSVLPSALPELPSFTCPDICWLAQVSWGAAAGGTQLGPYIWAGTLPYTGNLLLRVFLPAVQSSRATRTGGGGSSR